MDTPRFSPEPVPAVPCQPAGNPLLTSLSLLERARGRDAAAWQRLVSLYRPLVLFWCRRDGVTGPDAEDVSQDVFAAVAQALASFRHDRPGDTFRGWLHTITRNQVLLHVRRSRRTVRPEGGSGAWARLQETVDPSTADDPEELLHLGQLYRRALDLVRCEFEERTWQAFWLAVVEERPTDLVAAELGTSVQNVRQARSRILRRLKQEVGDLID